MNHFVAAPPVPSSYVRLAALSEAELAEARLYGYIADESDPSAPVGRLCGDPLMYKREMAAHGNDIRAWRARMYVVWFCYLFENLQMLRRPLYAVEELFLHFQSNILDDLAQMYAGAGADDKRALQEIELTKSRLHRYYSTATRLRAPFT